MPKLQGEEKQIWERLFVAALTGQTAFARDGEGDITSNEDDALIASRTADVALKEWRERCEPEPAEAAEAYALTPEEQKLAEELADELLEVWRERCEPEPHFNESVDAHAAYREALANWKQTTKLTLKEQALAAALPETPPMAMCSDPECAHPMAVHSEHGCMVAEAKSGLKLLCCAYCACRVQGINCDYKLARSLSGPDARLKPKPEVPV